MSQEISWKDKNLVANTDKTFYEIHLRKKANMYAQKIAFSPFFVFPVFSEEEPDLNNELEVSVCI